MKNKFNKFAIIILTIIIEFLLPSNGLCLSSSADYANIVENLRAQLTFNADNALKELTKLNQIQVDKLMEEFTTSGEPILVFTRKIQVNNNSFPLEAAHDSDMDPNHSRFQSAIEQSLNRTGLKLVSIGVKKLKKKGQELDSLNAFVNESQLSQLEFHHFIIADDIIDFSLEAYHNQNCTITFEAYSKLIQDGIESIVKNNVKSQSWDQKKIQDAINDISHFENNPEENLLCIIKK